MPNSAVDRINYPGSQEREQSADEFWSDRESDNNHSTVQDELNGTRALKRKRPLTVSCELCKQRKVRCDRAQPSCGWCTRNGQLCEYKERKKPGLRAGYGKELEQRLEKLEKTVQSQGRLIESYILQSQSQTGNGTSQAASFSYGSPLDQPVSTVPRQDNVHASSPSNISVNCSAQNHDSTTRLPQTPNLGHQDYSGNESSLTVPMNLFSNQEQSFADPDLDFPPYDLLYALVDLYFEHVNPWCPILHRRTTLDSFFGPSPLAEEDRMVLYAIVATTLRFSTDSRLTEQNRKQYHDSSKQKVLLYGLENSSVKALQALVILALDLVGSSNGPPGWKLLALITRSVVQLGLAVESKSHLVTPVYPSIYTLRAVVLPEPESWIEDESRRRLFWMVYLLDRYSTIATAFDFALDDKDIDRKLPCKEEYFVKNQPAETRWFRHSHHRTDYTKRSENIGFFGLYIEILGIFSRIHIFLKQPVDIGSLSDVEEWQSTYRKLDSELASWEFNLPPEYSCENSSRIVGKSKTARGLQCDWVQLHATYQTAVIRLHSSAAYPTTRSPIFTPSYSASQRCLLAVDSILTVTRLVVTNNLLDKFGPPFAFTLWVCARLLLVHGSTITHTVSPDFIFFVDTLAQMGTHWKVAERYSSILQRVIDEYGEYQQSTAIASEEGLDQRSTPSTVKILADMRRCAFDLDFLISRQPRSSPIGSATSTSGTGAGTGATSTGTDGGQLISQMPVSRNLAPHELEYLDIFGFFNVPRVPPTRADLFNNPISVDGMTTTTTGETVDDSDPVPASTTANEFNITNYLIPTPETDWLFRPG